MAKTPKMTVCKNCNASISAKAKICPSCGAKNKKPFYQRAWFIILIIIIVIGAIGGNGGSDESGNSNSDLNTSVSTETTQGSDTNAENTDSSKNDASIPAEYKSALRKAKIYSDDMHMSKAGIYDQLTSEYGEKFSAEAAQYAMEHLEADWNANALEKAKVYQDMMSMSPSAIYDQLTSEYGEKFTAEEAQYAIDHLE